MDMSDELAQVTARIVEARRRLAVFERERVIAKANFEQGEAFVATLRARYMASPEAGSNDIQRRAYADQQLTEEREVILQSQVKLANLDAEIIQATATLRIAEDSRRYLENLLRLGEIEVEPAATRPVAITTSATSDPNAAPF